MFCSPKDLELHYEIVPKASMIKWFKTEADKISLDKKQRKGKTKTQNLQQNQK